MKQTYLQIIKLSLLGVMIVLAISSPFIFAEQAKHQEIMFIIGNRLDQAPVSDVELEFYHQKPDGTLGDKIGSFISRKDKVSDGYFLANMMTGDYLYRVLSPKYQLEDSKEWESLHIEADDTVVLLWVNATLEAQEITIEDEKIPRAAAEKEDTGKKQKATGRDTIKKETKVSFSKNRTVDEIYANTKGDHQDANIGIFKALDISTNAWWTLGILAGIILFVIGLDYINRTRR